MTPPTPAKIDRLLQRRDKLLCRRDGLYDSAVIARIDTQLRDVPPGQDNRVDLALGRLCAVLPTRAGYLVSQAVTLELCAAEIAEMQARCSETMSEAPSYDGMWK